MAENIVTELIEPKKKRTKEEYMLWMHELYKRSRKNTIKMQHVNNWIKTIFEQYDFKSDHSKFVNEINISAKELFENQLPQIQETNQIPFDYIHIDFTLQYDQLVVLLCNSGILKNIYRNSQPEFVKNTVNFARDQANMYESDSNEFIIDGYF